MKGSISELAAKISRFQNILILTHQNPDGDTLGSATALYYGLKQKGKNAMVLCSDPFPQKFGYLFREFQEDEFDQDCVISVDVADPKLLGKKLMCFADSIDICIDHHGTNSMAAKDSYIDAQAAATCEIIFDLLKEMEVVFTPVMANSLYTGICTDTGCFKFSNTTARTHRIAAELIEFGCEYQEINTALFDTKSRARLEVERAALDSMEFYLGGRVAMMTLSQQTVQKTGATGEELDGVAGIPRQIEGVEIGITLREREEGGYRVSVRTCQYVDAAKLCGRLGGGGHKRAAGCTVSADLEETKKQLLEAINAMFEE